MGKKELQGPKPALYSQSPFHPSKLTICSVWQDCLTRREGECRRTWLSTATHTATSHGCELPSAELLS